MVGADGSEMACFSCASCSSSGFCSAFFIYWVCFSSTSSSSAAASLSLSISWFEYTEAGLQNEDSAVFSLSHESILISSQHQKLNVQGKLNSQFKKLVGLQHLTC